MDAIPGQFQNSPKKTRGTEMWSLMRMLRNETVLLEADTTRSLINARQLFRSCHKKGEIGTPCDKLNDRRKKQQGKTARKDVFTPTY